MEDIHVLRNMRDRLDRLDQFLQHEESEFFQ